MLFDIVIPSHLRLTKLLRCVQSIEKAKKQYDVSLHIYFTQASELAEFKQKYNKEWVFYYITNYKKASVFWNKHLYTMKADIMVYLNDDVVVAENLIQKISGEIQAQCPDYDGVLGIFQSNLPKDHTLPTAFGVIGKKFAERFPNRQVFCPDYFRFFGDKELEIFASSINKLYYSKDLRLEHHHPAYSNGKDVTHRLVRKYLPEDRYTFQTRQNKKLLWGQDFTLINKENNEI